MSIFSKRTCALAASAVLLVGAAAACGGSSSPIPSAAEDEAAAQRIVLTSADLPGFTREPHEPDDEDPSPVDECIEGTTVVDLQNSRSATGDDFIKGDGMLRVNSGAIFAVKESEARQALSDMKEILSGQCMRDGLRDSIRDGADGGLEVGDVTTSPLPELKVAADVEAARFKVPVEADGEDMTLYADMTFLRRGRVFGGVFTFQAGSPFPEEERARLATLIAERMGGKVKNTPDTGPVPTTAAPAPTTVAPVPKTAVTLRPSTTVATAGLTYIRFRDPSGVAFEHPRAWTVEPSSGTEPLFVFMDPTTGVPFRRNVNVLSQTTGRSMTLESYTEFSLSQLRAMPGVTIGESRPTTLSGFPAYRVSYRGDLGSGDLRFLAVWTIRGDKAWVVTYAADPARYNPGLPEIERLLTTIHLPA